MPAWNIMRVPSSNNQGAPFKQEQRNAAWNMIRLPVGPKYYTYTCFWDLRVLPSTKQLLAWNMMCFRPNCVSSLYISAGSLKSLTAMSWEHGELRSTIAGLPKPLSKECQLNHIKTLYIRLLVYIYIHSTYTYTGMYVCMYVSMHVYIYACKYLCI